MACGCCRFWAMGHPIRDSAPPRTGCGGTSAPTRSPATFRPQCIQAQEAVYYYYTWMIAHALHVLGGVLRSPNGPIHWAQDLAEQLVQRQLPNGAWLNRAAARKENVIPIADMVS